MAKYLDLKVGKKLKIYRFNTGTGQSGTWAFFSYTPYEKNPDGTTTYGQEYTIMISNINNVQFELKDGVSVEVEKINSVTADFQKYTSKKTGKEESKTVIKVAIDIVIFENGQTLPGANNGTYTPNANNYPQQPQYDNQQGYSDVDLEDSDGKDQSIEYALPNF